MVSAVLFCHECFMKRYFVKVLYKILQDHLLKIMIQRLMSKRSLFFKTKNSMITFI